VVAVHAGASTELFIVQCAQGEVSSPSRVEESSRAILATCLSCERTYTDMLVAIFCTPSWDKVIVLQLTLWQDVCSRAVGTYFTKEKDPGACKYKYLWEIGTTVYYNEWSGSGNWSRVGRKSGYEQWSAKRNRAEINDTNCNLSTVLTGTH